MIDIDLAGIRPRVATDDVGHLGMSRSHRAVQRHDLATPNAERQWFGETSTLQIADGERDAAVLWRLPRAGEHRFGSLPEGQFDHQIDRHPVRRAVMDHLPVA